MKTTIRVIILMGLLSFARTGFAVDSASAINSIVTPSPTPRGLLLTQVNVPCNGANQTQAGLESCAVVIPVMQGNLKRRLQLQVDGSSTGITPVVAGLYQGCDHSSVVSGVCSDGMPGISVPHESTTAAMCDPVAGAFNNDSAELLTDHHGKTCGQWAHPDASLHGHTCVLSMDYRHPYHTLEESWMRGAQVRGLDCHLTQVINEIGTGILKMTNVGTTPSPCAAVYAQITTLQTSAAQQEASLKASLAGQPNVKETELCTSSAVSNDPNNPDVGGLRQSACQLKAVQQSLEAAFVQMAACEVSTRLMYSYQAFLVAPDDGKTIDQEVMAMINGQEGNHTMCTVGYIQPRYESYYQARYFNRVNSVWNASVCK